LETSRTLPGLHGSDGLHPSRHVYPRQNAMQRAPTSKGFVTCMTIRKVRKRVTSMDVALGDSALQLCKKPVDKLLVPLRDSVPG